MVRVPASHSGRLGSTACECSPLNTGLIQHRPEASNPSMLNQRIGVCCAWWEKASLPPELSVHLVSRRGVDGNWRPLRLGARGYSAAGWTAFAVGNGMRFVAMRFGAQTVLAGLTSAQFVVVPMASYWLLGEAVTLSSVLGVVIILLGAVAAPETTFDRLS